MSLPDDEPIETPPPDEPTEGSPARRDTIVPAPSPDEGATPAENKDIQRLVELLPPEERAQLFSIFRRETTSHSGWLPTPAFMREYDELLPGLAERIVRVPEKEQDFRHATTTKIVEKDYSLRSRGQLFGMVALFVILAFCVLLVLKDHAEAAAWVAGTVIIGTVGVFVTGQVFDKSSSSKDLLEDD